ncbi:MAG: transglutaminase-like domain-containing protein [Bacteroidales bacterium]|nr:transglutaminase-like domain-containing protein [Bacteroidales bacterium]
MTAATNYKDLATLVSLLDDSDHTVVPVVRERLIDMGPPVIGILRSFSRHCHDNPKLLHRLEGVIADIQLHRSSDSLLAWCSGRDPDLIQGLCIVFGLIYPNVPTSSISQSLFEMANEVWMELNDSQTGVEQLQLFNHIFYHRLGFRVEDPFLSELKPALLDYAVANRRANPILFGLIYLAFAFRSGLAIRAVVFPGGFMPVCVDDQNRVLFYINIYKSGELFDKEQLRTFLADLGFVIPSKDFVLCDTVTLVGIYAESLYFVAGNTENKEMERLLEEALTFFGDKRILIMEEDE